MNTSKQAYETASDNYVKATADLHAAKKAVLAAELAYYEATEELARHEAKPGIPLYTQAAQS